MVSKLQWLATVWSRGYSARHSLQAGRYLTGSAIILTFLVTLS